MVSPASVPSPPPSAPLAAPWLWLRQLSALAVQEFNGKSRVLAWRVARLRFEEGSQTG